MGEFRTLPIILVLLSLFSLFSCSEEKPPKETTSLKFTIDTSLVTDYISFNDFKLIMRIPKNWEKLNDSELDEILTKLKTSDEFNKATNYQPEFVFKNDSTQSVLAIGKVNYTSNLQEYLSSINNLFSEWEIRKGEFSNNKINFTQYLMQKDNIVLFKLIFKNYNKIIQIDYSLSKQFYVDEIKKVESSIGSIKPITN